MWSFLDDPTAAGGSFVSVLVLLISGALKVVDALKKRNEKKMKSIPPTALPSSADTSQRILRTLDALTAEAVLRQTQLSEQEVRAELRVIGEQLLTAKHQIAQLESALASSQRDLQRKAIQLAATQTQLATVHAVKDQLVSRIEALTADLERADKRTDAIALELHTLKVDRQAAFSVELGLTDATPIVTPLRPPPRKGSTK